TSHKDCWTCTSGRIDGGVGDGDADQMDERQRQTDGETSKPNRRSTMGGTQDDDEKHISHHNLANKGGKERVATRRMGFIAVGSKSALNNIKSRLSGGHEIKHKRAGNCGDDLGYDVRN